MVTLPLMLLPVLAPALVISATRAVPDAFDFNVKKPPVVKVLPFTLPIDNPPVNVSCPARLTSLLMMRFFIVLVANAPAGMVWGVEPFSSMVPLEAVKMPVLLMLPPICKVAADMVSVVPL